MVPQPLHQQSTQSHDLRIRIQDVVIASAVETSAMRHCLHNSVMMITPCMAVQHKRKAEANKVQWYIHWAVERTFGVTFTVICTKEVVLIFLLLLFFRIHGLNSSTIELHMEGESYLSSSRHVLGVQDLLTLALLMQTTRVDSSLSY